MICHLYVFPLWIVLYGCIYTTFVHAVSTTCGNFQANKSSTDFEDGQRHFEIVIRHHRLNPYLDIIPNITYLVVIQQSKPGIELTEFSIDIQSDDLQTTSSDADQTTVDTNTSISLAKSASHYDIQCMNSSVVKWTPRSFIRCYNISAYITTDEAIAYYVATRVCRETGRRVYYSADVHGYIESPHYPGVYPDGYNISHIIFSTSTSSVRVQFQSFNLEPPYRGLCFDNVTVVTDQTHILCGAIEGEDLHALFYESKASTLTISFTTDNKIGRSGFRLIYYSFETDECNKTLPFHSGHLNSIGYPETYFPHMNCIIVITLPPEYRVRVTIRDLDIQAKTNGACSSDSLLISSGSVNQTLCGTLSDYEKNELIFMSPHSTVEISFITNYLVEKRGYSLEYTSHIPCSNNTYTNESGSLFSDDFPNFYSSNQDCFYTIDVSDRHAVLEIIFESFHTESFDDRFLQGDLCNNDYIEINIDGKTNKLCGLWKGKANPLTFISDSGIIGIRFVTNERESRSGFHVTWQSVSKNSSFQCSSSWYETSKLWFEVVRTPLTWRDSFNYCRQEGGYLVTINDNETQQNLEALLSQGDNCSQHFDAYWIGANDVLVENEFSWADGQPLDFTFWFRGWRNHSYNNNQPSDDGLSGEDCVEMRTTFHKISKGLHDVSRFYWNDRQCNIRNPFICQIDKNKDKHDSTTTSPSIDNDRKFQLDDHVTEITISSPGFPEHYLSLTEVNYTVIAPEGFLVSIKFLHFDIEDSERCQYDKLTLKSLTDVEANIVFCGDFNDKLKKLDWVSDTNIAIITFITDKSISKTGFSFIAAMYKDNHCNQTNAVYSSTPFPECLLPSYQRVSLNESRIVCTAQNASLLSRLSSTSACLLRKKYIANGASDNDTLLLWKDTPKDVCEFYQINPNCVDSSVVALPCNTSAFYVCSWTIHQKKKSTVLLKNGNGSVSMTKSNVTYNNNVIVQYIFSAPQYHRILLRIDFLNLEYQRNCLYDSLFLDGFKNVTELCGNVSRSSPSYFTSFNNNASITFKTDSSVLGEGFQFSWFFIDSLSCFKTISLNDGGVIELYNKRKPFHDVRHCCSEIVSPIGSRIILNISNARMTSSQSCVVIIFDTQGTSWKICGLETTHEILISSSNFLSLCLNAQQLFSNDGFSATYKIDYADVLQLPSYIRVEPNSTGEISSPHFPFTSPRNIDQTVELVAPVGFFFTVNFTGSCDDNGTKSSNIRLVDATLGDGNQLDLLTPYCNESMDEYAIIQSNLNKLKLVFNVGPGNKRNKKQLYHASYSVNKDDQYLAKTELYPGVPFSNCSHLSCINGGSCIEHENHGDYICSCPLQYTGMFCQVTWCDLPVCHNNGRCILDNHSYHCECHRNFWGDNCEMASAECATTICSGNGVCIKDWISGKKCSCNKDWTGSNCSEKVHSAVDTKSSNSLLDKPIWIGMIVVLILLLLFGILVLLRRRCSRYCKCCEDTDQILKKQAENAIPAHKNVPPSDGTPSSSTILRLQCDIEAATNSLQVENRVDPIQTPPIEIGNIDAAARLFEAYKNKSERSERRSATSGIVDGQVKFLHHDIDTISSDNECHEKELNLRANQHLELRRSCTSLPRSQKEKASKFVKTNSLHADVERGTHCYPHIVIVNDSSHESLSNVNNQSTDTKQESEVRDRRKSIQRQKTLDDGDAKMKREVFASKSKSSGTKLDLPPFDLQLRMHRHRLTRSRDDVTRRARSPSLTPTSFDSEPTYKNRRRLRLTSWHESSDDDGSRIHTSRSFSSQPDRLHEVRGCKCCDNKGHRRSNHNSRRKHLRVSRKKTRQHHNRSVYSDRSSSCEKVRHRRQPSLISDSIKGSSSYKLEALSRNALSVPNQCTESAKKVSMHIMEENRNSDEYYKLPVRKSRSNDLSINKSGYSNQDENSPFRRRSSSFHSEISDARRSKHDPDELLNADQKSTVSFFLEQENSRQNQELPERTIELSIKDPTVTVVSSAFSVTDTDTGFSSSSPWRETVDDLPNEIYKINLNKDSAYQTKQSSVDHHRYEGPNNSYENPEDFSLIEHDMTKRLQQAVKRLALLQKNSQVSKDSAFTLTFSEADDTASCDSEKSPREIHPPLRPRTSNFTLYPKHFPLEQVSEEGDSHSQEAISNDHKAKCSTNEEIEMQEFTV